MNEMCFYRPGDGVTIYVETGDSDEEMDAAIAAQKIHGFIWVPDFR